MFNWLFKLFGRRYVNCRVCGRQTEPSRYFNDLCSMKCFNYSESVQNASEVEA